MPQMGRLDRAARANAYDVLIVDRMLPKCDGLTVIGSLRAEEIRTPPSS